MDLKDRPKIKPEISSADKIVEVASATVLLAISLLFLLQYPSVDEKVPMHYDFSGNVDRIGNKAELFFLFAILLLLYAGMTIAQRYPHSFNYLTEITHENALRQYSAAVKMIRWLKLQLVCLFSFIIAKSIFPDYIGDGVFFAVIITFIVTTFIQMIAYFVKSGK